ncbi:MAG: c-type cytochrome [Rhizomicrobium sp.]
MPLPPKARLPRPQPLPKRIAATARTLARGQLLFEHQCARCHLEGGGFGAYPDLWNMSKTAIDGFSDIVYGGALHYAGMGNFSDSLSNVDVAAIEAFIVDDEIAKRANGATRPTPRVRYH